MPLSERLFLMGEGVRLAFDAISANRVRALLTISGIAVGVLVLALAFILWFHILPVGPTVALLVIGYLAIESFAQRRVETLLLRVTVLLAMVSAVLLAMFYTRELVLLGRVQEAQDLLADAMEGRIQWELDEEAIVGPQARAVLDGHGGLWREDQPFAMRRRRWPSICRRSRPS